MWDYRNELLGLGMAQLDLDHIQGRLGTARWNGGQIVSRLGGRPLVVLLTAIVDPNRLNDVRG